MSLTSPNFFPSSICKLDLVVCYYNYTFLPSSLLNCSLHSELNFPSTQHFQPSSNFLLPFKFRSCDLLQNKPFCTFSLPKFGFRQSTAGQLSGNLEFSSSSCLRNYSLPHFLATLPTSATRDVFCSCQASARPKRSGKSPCSGHLGTSLSSAQRIQPRHCHPT